MNRSGIFLAAAIAVVLIGAAAYFAFTMIGAPAPSASDEVAEIPDAWESHPGNVAGEAGELDNEAGFERNLPGNAEAPEHEEEAEADTGGHIQVKLYVLSGSGMRLTAETQEIPLERSLQRQATEVVRLLLRRSAAIPRGVALREVFITSQGIAYVDLSRELVSNHPGGTSAEELTVYGISNTLIANFPAIQLVRILVEGREIQTLAGHLDLTVPYGRAPLYLRPPSENPESRDEAS